MMNIKNLAHPVVVKASDNFQQNKAKYIGMATALMTTASTFMLQAGAEGETVDVTADLVASMSGVNYNIVLNAVVALIPVIFPAVFNLTAIRKGISFVLGLMRGA